MAEVTIGSGAVVSYEVAGRDADPVLVLVEGLGAQLVGWRDELVARFVEAGLRVVRLDNRDVGRSQRYPGTEYTVTDMASDVHGLLDALGVEQFHVVGQSMGGMIAQEVALTAPERVLSLSLFYTAASLDYDTSDERDADVIAALPVPTTRAEFVEQYLETEQVCGSPGYPTDVGWKRELGGLLWDRGYDVDGVVRQREAVGRSPERLSRLSALTMPTTVLHGEDDRLIPAVASRDIAGAITGSELKVYPGMGHELPVALWDDFVDRILTVVRRGEALRSASVPA